MSFMFIKSLIIHALLSAYKCEIWVDNIKSCLEAPDSDQYTPSNKLYDGIDKFVKWTLCCHKSVNSKQNKKHVYAAAYQK